MTMLAPGSSNIVPASCTLCISACQWLVHHKSSHLLFIMLPCCAATDHLSQRCICIVCQCWLYFVHKCMSLTLPQMQCCTQRMHPRQVGNGSGAVCMLAKANTHAEHAWPVLGMLDASVHQDAWESGVLVTNPQHRKEWRQSSCARGFNGACLSAFLRTRTELARASKQGCMVAGCGLRLPCSFHLQAGRALLQPSSRLQQHLSSDLI